jgi:hypothetical protein
MRVTICLATAVLLAGAAPAPAPAVAQGNTSAADTREVVAYRLSMPKLQQLNRAMADLQRQRDADPAYQRLQKKKQEFAALSEKEEPTEAEMARMARLEEEIDAAEQAEEEPEETQSLSAMAARMAADKRIAGALQRAGLAPREAAVMQLALIQAAFTAEMLETGAIKEMPEDVSAENVKFCQVHKAEIMALTALQEREER